MSKSNSFKKSRKLALGIAVAMGCSMASVAFADQTITEPIIGPGNLPFSENVNVEVSNNLIAGGPWLPNIGAAVSASEEGTELSIDMGNNALSIIGNNDGHSTGIAAINKGKVEITSTGDLSVYAESTNGNKGQTAALFVNGGGQILIHNDDNVLSLNGTTGNSTNGAVVKAMNGAKDTRSYIKIDGLVDINAKTDNGVGMSEAVSAVASTIDIGGGKIFATKKGVNPGLNYGFAENCAIRAYGEFVSSNYGIVNVNVVKDGDALDAKATGAGDKEVQIFGDFNTVGGMGTKGTINVGLNTSESYWVGDYIKGAGWGETPGDYGSVNLFMGNQARWLGNASFATNVKMSDPGTLWQGYSLNNAVSAEITNGAAWYNYNEADTTALLRLAGSSNAKNAGLVYMTPFTKTVDGKSASYNTGNVSIANYAGNMKVFYEHDAQNATNILGGNFTIANAEKGSTINLITDNTGISNGNTTQINQVLDKLANKLYYTAYTTGERNLDGTVTIAEGLTSSSVAKKTGKISYSSTDAQGSLNPATTTAARMKVLQAFARYASSDLTTSLNDDSGLEFNTSITGDASEDTDYVTAGVIDQGNGSYNFKENVTINSEVGALVQPNYTTYNKFVAPIYTAVGKDITINMNNNTLNINHIAGNEYNASKLVGLAAGQGSSLEINNAGNINVTFANEKGNNHTGALAYGGGKLIIHNGGENQDQKIFSFNGLYEAKGKRGLYAETKKSDSGEESQIVIDGLVNIVAKDTSVYGGAAVSESYAVQADSAQIDIGGGKFVGRLEAKHTYNYGDMTRINVNTQKDNDGNVIGAGDNVVQIDGDLRAKGSKKAVQVNVGLNGEDSYLRGNVIGTQSSNATLDNESAYDSTTKYGVNIYMDNGADWTGGAKGALTLRMHNGATWHGGSNAEKDSDAINHMSMTLDTGAVWYHNGTHDIAVDYFTGGKDEAARGTIVMDGDKNITLSNYTGNTIVSFVRDSEYPTRVLGGNITIGSAAEGSVITLSTDNDGIDTSNAGEVSKVLRKLANKLTYTGAIEGAENNLDGYVQIAEGLTASSAALKLGDINFSAEDGKGSLKEGSIITPENKKNPEVIYGDKETAMMKGAKTAMASTALLWRAENNDLMKRMGDLRLSEDESGIWAKYYGGKYSMDAQNTDLNLKYNAYQVGYDKEVGNGWKAGVALSYNDGNSSYGNGRADIKGTYDTLDRHMPDSVWLGDVNAAVYNNGVDLSDRYYYDSRRQKQNSASLMLQNRQEVGKLEWGWMLDYMYQNKKYRAEHINTAYPNSEWDMQNQPLREWSRYKSNKYTAQIDGGYKLNDNNMLDFLINYSKEGLDIDGSNMAKILGGQASQNFLSAQIRNRYEQDLFNVQLQDSITLDKEGTWIFTPSVRYNQSKITGFSDGKRFTDGQASWIHPKDSQTKGKATWQLALKKEVNENLTLRMTGGTYYRLLNMAEIAGDGAGILPAPRNHNGEGAMFPVPEEGKQFDISAIMHNKLLGADNSTTLTYYWRDSTNMLQLERAGKDYWSYFNDNKGKSHGIELQSSFKWNKFDLDLQVTYLNTSAYNKHTATQFGEYASVWPTYQPEWEGNIRLTYRPSEKFSVFAEGHYTDEYFTYYNKATSGKLSPYLSGKPVCSLFVMNSGLKWMPKKNWQLTFGCNDILNKGPKSKIRSDAAFMVPGYINPEFPIQGRTYYVTARYQF